MLHNHQRTRATVSKPHTEGLNFSKKWVYAIRISNQTKTQQKSKHYSIVILCSSHFPYFLSALPFGPRDPHIRYFVRVFGNPGDRHTVFEAWRLWQLFGRCWCCKALLCICHNTCWRIRHNSPIIMTVTTKCGWHYHALLASLKQTCPKS